MKGAKNVKLHSATRKALPIYEYKSKICELISNNEVLLVTSETVSVIKLSTHTHIHTPYLYHKYAPKNTNDELFIY